MDKEPSPHVRFACVSLSLSPIFFFFCTQILKNKKCFLGEGKRESDVCVPSLFIHYGKKNKGRGLTCAGGETEVIVKLVIFGCVCVCLCIVLRLGAFFLYRFFFFFAKTGGKKQKSKKGKNTEKKKN